MMAASIAAVVADVPQITGAAVLKHNARASGFQLTTAFGQFPESHASLPDLATAFAPNERLGCAVDEMPDRSRMPLLSTMSLLVNTAPVAASFTVTTSESKSPP